MMTSTILQHLPLLCLAAAALATAVQPVRAAAAGEIWLDQNFSRAHDYQSLPATTAKSAGQLPKGWIDRNVWSTATATFAHQTENGIGFLHGQVTGQGKLQIAFPLNRRLTGTAAFRLTFRARGNAGVLIGIRQADQPEESDFMLASAIVTLTPDWQDHSVTFRSAADPRPLAFYLNFGAPGTLDLASLRLEQIPLADYTIPTLIPLIREPGAVTHHQNKVAETQAQKADVIFLGDSITDDWDGNGDPVWKRDIAPLNAVNFGIGANKIEHVLWQVQHMGLGETCRPRLIVLAIGINNVFQVQSEIDMVDGITHLIAEIRRRSPRSALLISGILPQGREPNTLRRQQIQRLNRHYASFADNRQIFFRDFGDSFLTAGHFPEDVSADATHLTLKGYEIWSASLTPMLKELLARK